LCSSKYVLGRYGEDENGLVVLHAMGEGRNASRPRGWCLWVAVALHCAVIARRVCEWHVSARLQSSVIRISSRLSRHAGELRSAVLVAEHGPGIGAGAGPWPSASVGLVLSSHPTLPRTTFFGFPQPRSEEDMTRAELLPLLWELWWGLFRMHW
jgi:hypothetical protein